MLLIGSSSVGEQFFSPKIWLIFLVELGFLVVVSIVCFIGLKKLGNLGFSTFFCVFRSENWCLCGYFGVWNGDWWLKRGKIGFFLGISGLVGWCCVRWDADFATKFALD